MTDKQKYALEKLATVLPDSIRALFLEIAEYAISLGYLPKIMGARETYVDFIKPKVGRSILKIDTDPNFVPRMAIRFYALGTYPALLHQAVVNRAVQLRDKYDPRCSGCGRCDGTHGYSFTFPDGQEGFWCGRDIITLPAFSAKDLPEIKNALKAQDDFHLAHFSK